MSEGDFIEDDIDSILYHSIPITSKSFKGLWVLSALFSGKKYEKLVKLILSRKQKQAGLKAESPKEVQKFETIEI